MDALFSSKLMESCGHGKVSISDVWENKLFKGATPVAAMHGFVHQITLQ